MKVSELYILTKQIMFEKPNSTIYDNFLIGNVNLVLAELFEENNIARVFNGKEPFASIPLISEQEDEIEYEEEYQRKVIPYGLASKFFIDDDLQKYSIFSTEYNNARVLAQKVVSLEELEKYAIN